MEKENQKKLLYLIINALISIITSNLGILALPENKYIGILTILIAFIFLYLSFKTFQITKNEKNIEEIQKEIKLLKQHQKINWKLLNTYSDNKLVEKINKLLKDKMNKKGFTDSDILELLKIIVLFIVGFIINPQ